MKRSTTSANFNHGNPLDLADQALLFKRAVREAALRHGVYATFMAKPMENQPGSSMHIHQSVIDSKKKTNLFATKAGKGQPTVRLPLIGITDDTKRAVEAAMRHAGLL